MQPKVRMTRKGEIVKSCPKGFKLWKGTCIKMPALEMQRRREGARKAQQNRGARKPRKPAGAP